MKADAWNGFPLCRGSVCHSHSNRLNQRGGKPDRRGVFSPPKGTHMNVDHLMRAAQNGRFGEGGELRKKSNLEELCSTFPWFCSNSLLHLQCQWTWMGGGNVNERKTIRGPEWMWKECDFGNLPHITGNYFHGCTCRTCEAMQFSPDTIWISLSQRWVSDEVPPLWKGVRQNYRLHILFPTCMSKSSREWANICYFLLIWGFYSKTIRDH